MTINQDFVYVLYYYEVNDERYPYVSIRKTNKGIFLTADKGLKAERLFVQDMYNKRKEYLWRKNWIKCFGTNVPVIPNQVNINDIDYQAHFTTIEKEPLQ